MSTAVVIGATGGIGAALIDRLVADQRYDRIVAASRRRPELPAHVEWQQIDLADDASIESAAGRIGAPMDLLLVATGMLHDAAGGPERSLRSLEPDRLARSFAVNAIGPAMVLRHFAPLLPRERRAVIACLSAKVGSISDNRLGGWYGYRAAKAALNQIVRTAAIEIARTRPEAVCVALHPGTVDTALSRPFQRAVAAGRLFAPAHAAERLLHVLDALAPADSGGFFGWDGAAIAP